MLQIWLRFPEELQLCFPARKRGNYFTKLHKYAVVGGVFLFQWRNLTLFVLSHTPFLIAHQTHFITLFVISISTRDVHSSLTTSLISQMYKYFVSINHFSYSLCKFLFCFVFCFHLFISFLSLSGWKASVKTSIQPEFSR